jgi:hypothetical protein
MASKFLIDIDLNGNEIQNFGIQTTGTLPTSPFNGQVVNHSGVLKVYETSSTSWKYVSMDTDGSTLTETSGVISVGAIPQTSVTGLASSLGGKVDDSQVLTDVPASAVFTDTQLTAEEVQDMVGDLVSGSGATSVTYDDTAGTLVISSANDNTEYEAGNGIVLSETAFSVEGGDGLTQESGGLKVDATVVRTAGAQSIAGVKTFSDNVVINGDLTVSGAVTSKLSEEVLIEDNKIVVNSNEAGAPSEDAGIVVERGTSDNVEVMWDESADRWSFTNDGATFYNIPVPSEYGTANDNDFVTGAAFNDATGEVTLSVANQSDVTVDLDGRYLESYTESNDYGTIAVSGQTSVAASSVGDTVTYVAAGGMTITTAADTVTFSSANDNTTYSIQDGELSQNNFTNADHTKLNGIEDAATADQSAAELRTAIGTGNGNLVPAAGSAGQFLKHDGTFGAPSYTTDTNRDDASVYALFSGGSNITVSAAGVIAGSADTQLSDSYVRGLFSGGANITLDAAGEIVGTADTQLSAEEVQDMVGAMVSGNTENGISAVYQDSDGTLDFQNANINYTHDEASYTGGTLEIDGASNGVDIANYAVTVQVWDMGSSNHQQVMTNVILDTNNDLIKVDLPAGDWRVAIQGIRL